MEKVYCPFTEDQVKNLNAFQKLGFVHEFTCCSPHDILECQRRLKGENIDSASANGTLIATTSGWFCPCGKYTQDWAYDFMFDVKKIVEDWNSEWPGKAHPIAMPEI